MGGGVGAVLLLFGAWLVVRFVHYTGQDLRMKRAMIGESAAARMEDHRREVKARLEQDKDGWQRILNQMLADALPGANAHVGKEGLLSLSATPAPGFRVAGEENRRAYLFTIEPPEAQRKLFGGRKAPQVMPLDASLYPAVQVEVQSVWEYLVAQYPWEDIPDLPRSTSWYLVVQDRRQEAEKRAAGLPEEG